MPPVELSRLPGYEALQSGQPLGAETIAELRDSVRNNLRDMSAEQRQQLKKLIERWLEERRNQQDATHNRLREIRDHLDPSWYNPSAVYERIVPGFGLMGQGISTGTNAAVDFISDNTAANKPMLQRLGVVAGVGFLSYWLAYKPARWALKYFDGFRKDSWGWKIARGLGLVGMLAGVAAIAGTTGHARDYIAARQVEGLTPPSNEEARLAAIAATTGPLTLDRVRSLNLLDSRLRSPSPRDIQFGGSPPLRVAFVDGTEVSGEETRSTTNIRINGTRTFSLSSPDVALGNLSLRLGTGSNSTLRVSDNVIQLLLEGGAVTKYIDRADFNRVFTEASRHTGSTALTRNLPMSDQPNLTNRRNVSLTFTPIGTAS